MINKTQKIILALDNYDRNQIFEILKKINNRIDTVKIGLELFCKYGSNIVEEIRDKFGLKIFLDLKLHDIPNTTSKAIKSLDRLPIDFLTIHLSGGEEMIVAALKSAKQYIPHTKILGVSYLTSLSSKNFKDNWGLETDEQIKNAFKKIFELAAKTSIHGLVLSPHEIKLAKEVELERNKIFCKVTPGVRFRDDIENNLSNDQARVMTPQDAFEQGSNMLVIGRSLTQSNNLDERISELIKAERDYFSQ